MDESVRWLTANNRMKEATKIIKKAARFNNVSLSQIQPFLDIKEIIGTVEATDSDEHATQDTKMIMEKELLGVEQNSSSSEKARQQSFFQAWIALFRNSKLRLNSIVAWALWYAF